MRPGAINPETGNQEVRLSDVYERTAAKLANQMVCFDLVTVVTEDGEFETRYPEGIEPIPFLKHAFETAIRREKNIRTVQYMQSLLDEFNQSMSLIEDSQNLLPKSHPIAI